MSLDRVPPFIGRCPVWLHGEGRLQDDSGGKGEQLDLVHLLMEIQPCLAQQVDKQHLLKRYLLKVPESVSSSCSFSTCSPAIARCREIKLRLSNCLVTNLARRRTVIIFY